MRDDLNNESLSGHPLSVTWLPVFSYNLLHKEANNNCTLRRHSFTSLDRDGCSSLKLFSIAFR